jgi:hypothetical protein
MHRRLLLTSLGVAIGGLATGGTGLLVSRMQPHGPIPQGARTLAVDLTAVEVLAGTRRTLALEIRTLANQQIARVPFRTFLRSTDGVMLAGPFPAVYEQVTADGLGVYLTRLDLSDPGTFELVAVHGRDWGATPLRVLRPEDSAAPAPGERAVPAPTPTMTEARGFAVLCSQDPPCAMHADSVDAALAAHRPIALLFATPRYCVSATCAPAVATLDAVRRGGRWGDTAFVHCEVYADPDGTQLGAPVQAWGPPPSEPCLFTITRDGHVADRLEGPQVPSLVRTMVEQLGETA